MAGRAARTRPRTESFRKSKVEGRSARQDRVFCERCTEFSGAFRELACHQQRQHNPPEKKWICVELADGIISYQYRPVNPLSKCNACARQKKEYGAYYNAAAHLRRAHFQPKVSRRNRDLKLEKRGDWPPKAELKR
jgi:hypothetical protein